MEKTSTLILKKNHQWWGTRRLRNLEMWEKRNSRVKSKKKRLEKTGKLARPGLGLETRTF